MRFNLYDHVCSLVPICGISIADTDTTVSDCGVCVNNEDAICEKHGISLPPILPGDAGLQGIWRVRDWCVGRPVSVSQGPLHIRAHILLLNTLGTWLVMATALGGRRATPSIWWPPSSTRWSSSSTWWCSTSTWCPPSSTWSPSSTPWSSSSKQRPSSSSMGWPLSTSRQYCTSSPRKTLPSWGPTTPWLPHGPSSRRPR